MQFWPGVTVRWGSNKLNNSLSSTIYFKFHPIDSWWIKSSLSIKDHKTKVKGECHFILTLTAGFWCLLLFNTEWTPKQKCVECYHRGRRFRTKVTINIMVIVWEVPEVLSKVDYACVCSWGSWGVQWSVLCLVLYSLEELEIVMEAWVAVLLALDGSSVLHYTQL